MRALLLLTISLLIQTNAYDEYDYDEDGTDYRNIIESKRPEEIKWPYTYLNKEEHAEPDIKYGNLFGFSIPRNPIMDAMMKSIKSFKNKDLFSCLRDDYPLPKGYRKPLDVYDYVIVGAGSAGSVLASRLTEDKPHAMVLLLEAGQPESLLTDIPMMVGLWTITPISDYAWPYVTERQPGICLGSEDQRCFWPRGRAVGGSSVINYMMYTRGRPQDWDRIAADGNYGWSYDDVLHYYLKSEKAHLERLPKDAPYHNHHGELAVENVSFRTGLVEAFLEAGRQMGFPTLDYNAPDGFGFGYVQTTTGNGHRASSAKTFLHPHKRRQNLHILTGARATKVLIDPKTKRAYAVKYTRNGKKYTVRCRREVILSAGPIASPQLLMLSGVGPKHHLKSLGIPVIKDLPVGQTIYDHIAFPTAVFKLNTTNVSLNLNRIATVPNLIKWLHYGDGLLSSIGTVEGLGYIKTSQSDDPEPVPDIELISLAGSIAFDNGAILRRSWRITDETYNTGFSPLNGYDTWTAVPLLLQPRSKGHLELRDANPFSLPKLYSNYLTDPRDIATLKEAIQFIIKLGESEPFRKYGAQLYLAKYEACRNEVPGSDAYWDCAIRTMVITFHHQISTCRMGPSNDPYAVVDPELRVYGIEGLRVVDSSAIPRPTSAHTNAPAMMIGEKAADMIKHTWSKANHYKEYF